MGQYICFADGKKRAANSVDLAHFAPRVQESGPSPSCSSSRATHHEQELVTQTYGKGMMLI